MCHSNLLRLFSLAFSLLATHFVIRGRVLICRLKPARFFFFWFKENLSDYVSNNSTEIKPINLISFTTSSYSFVLPLCIEHV